MGAEHAAVPYLCISLLRKFTALLFLLKQDPKLVVLRSLNDCPHGKSRQKERPRLLFPSFLAAFAALH